jgi:pimeloyl-ACP methyl ester carboxylesterase
MTHARAVSLAFVLMLPVNAEAQSFDTLPAAVGGRHVHMVGTGSGLPTVVLEAGFMSTSRTWSLVQAELAKTHRVIAYDRAGLGRSAPSGTPRTSRAIAAELREALRSVGAAPPFLLVGHSAGGLHVRVFAGMYPEEVVGLVLVDPAPEEFYDRARREWPQVYAYFDSLGASEIASAPPGVRAEDAEWEQSLIEARESDGKYRAPVILLSSPQAELRELAPIWVEEHRKWVARGARREHVMVEGAGHNIQRERPELVVDAVRRVQRIP